MVLCTQINKSAGKKSLQFVFVWINVSNPIPVFARTQFLMRSVTQQVQHSSFSVWKFTWPWGVIGSRCDAASPSLPLGRCEPTLASPAEGDTAANSHVAAWSCEYLTNSDLFTLKWTRQFLTNCHMPARICCVLSRHKSSFSVINPNFMRKTEIRKRQEMSKTESCRNLMASGNDLRSGLNPYLHGHWTHWQPWPTVLVRVSDLWPKGGWFASWPVGKVWVGDCTALLHVHIHGWDALE